MKNKILFVLFLILSFILFAFCYLYLNKAQPHKVLKIIRPDLFYVDINDNNKIDNNELFKLDGVYSFSDELNNFVIEHSEKLHLDRIDYLKVGFLAKQWAIENLEGEYIIIKSKTVDKTKNYQYIEAEFKGFDLAEFYLKNGLAFAGDNSNYLFYQDNIQIRKNIQEASKLDFVLLNINSNVYHKLDCEQINLIHKAKLILSKNAKNYVPCKICHSTFKTPDTPKTDKNELLFYKKFGNIELFFTNPLIYKKPDNTCSNNICKRLVEEIDNSEYSINIAIYGIGNVPKVFDALKKAKNRGVKIRAIVDYSKKMDEIYSKTIDFIDEFSAVTDKSEIIMHNKFFIFDNKKVFTGSANISPSGIGGYSANSVAVINDEKIVQRYKLEFEQLYNLKFSNSKNKLSAIENSEINVYFSPKDNIKNVVLSKINSSQEEICVSAFYLTDKDVINALINASKRGVRVFIILDAVSANKFKNKVWQMRKSGIALIVENWGGKDHEKTMLFDKKTLLLGSLNFTSAGFNKNDENVILINNSDIAKFYRTYFFYLFNSIDKIHLRYIPRAEGFDSINSCQDGVDNNFDGKTDNEDDGCKQR